MSTNKVAIFENFRENVLLLAVFFLMYSGHPRAFSFKDVTSLIMYFVILGMFMIQAVVAIIRNKTLYRWEKAFFIATQCYMACLIAVRPFTELPSVMESISIGWLAAIVLVMFIVVFRYYSLQKKGKWSSSIPFEIAYGLAFSNYITIMVSFLAIMDGCI